jgi:DNA/RNA-binding domain of Phe-tRNA-synthetase-like protein
MFTRVSKGKGLPHINPIVDLGNALSLKYVLPMGAHDIDQMHADMEVRFSRPEDTFLPFGEPEAEKPNENELLYVVGNEVRTRRWTWRQSEIGKIGRHTKNVFYPIDGFSGVNEDAVLKAREELAAAARMIFKLQDVRVAFLDKDTREVEL